MRKLILTLLIMVVGTSFYFAQQQVLKPTKVVEPVYHDLSPALRDIEPILPGIIDHKAWKESEVKKVPNQRFIKEGNEPLAPENIGPDPVLQMYMGINAAMAPILNFEGIANINAVYPPDTDGDVGPNHYVQMINLSFAIFNKSGTLLYGPVDNSTLWSGFTGPWSGSNDGDPIILYDQQADRWLFSQFALPNYPNGPFYELIAISQTGDPTGPWYRYAYSFTDMCDYPKFGIWPDAYYMSINNFASGTLGWNGVGVAALERDSMLVGGTARMVYYQLSSSADPWSFLPSDWDGTSTPPVGAPNYFIYAADDYYWGGADRLEIYEFHVDWTNTSNSTFTGPTALSTASFDMYLCGATRDRCITQPGTSVMLEAIPDRLMFRLQYRNFGSYQAMVTNHTVDADGSGKAGIRWYELRNTGTGWGIHQQGTYSPDSDHRWMGSVAMDGQGNIALGYSVSSSTTYPSIRYTGRYASDPLGQMTFTEENIMTGSGSQTGSAARWGDYSMMSIDPTDDQTFWYTQEYIQTTGSVNWQTRVASFQFALAAGPTISLSDDTLTFGTTYVGFPDTTTLTIRNLGDANLNITDITTDNPEFSATPSNFTIGPGSYQNVVIEFDPTTAGSKTGTLTVLNNDSTVTVYCLGEGAVPPDIDVTPTSYDVTLNSGDSTTQQMNIANNGLGDLFFNITLQEGTPPLFMPFIIKSKDEVLGRNAQPLNDPYLLDIYSDFKTNSNPISIPFETNKIMYDPGDIVLTHSASQSIISGNSVSCNSGGYHTDNSYWRSFDLNSFGIYSGLNVKAVEVGIETATSSGSGQPLTVNLYTSAGAFPGGARTLIGTASTTVMDQSGTIISIPVTATVPAGSELVVEIFTPNGQATGNSFFIGSNNLGETAPSYLSAADCGVPTPVTTGSLGFPNMHIVMNVVAGNSWLSLSEYSDTVHASAVKSINVKFNAKELFDGDYYNDIIIANNDPSNPEVIVPAHLQVNGIPDISVSDDSLFYDTTFIGKTDTTILTIENTGTKTLSITNISTTEDYSVNLTSLSIPPSQSEDVQVVFTPTSQGKIDGILTITSDDPDESPLNVYLFGTGINPPIIGVNPTSFDESVMAGDSVIKNLRISNTGTANLLFNIDFSIPTSYRSTIHIPASDGNFPKGFYEPSTGVPPSDGKPTSKSDSPSITLASIMGYGIEESNDIFVNFDLTNPNTLNTIAAFTHTTFSNAGDFEIDDQSFVYELDNANNFVKIDISTGTVTPLTSPSIAADWTAMAVDPVSGILYAIGGDNLYTIDPTNSNTTLIGATGQSLVIGLAIDDESNMWAYELTNDNFLSIDKSTGLATVVGSIGFDANFGQGMTWNANDDQIYMTAFNNSAFQPELRLVDKSTGNTSLIGAIGNVVPSGTCQLGWLAIPGAGGWLKLSDLSGVVPGGTYLDIDVLFDASKLVDGDYYKNINIHSNDIVNPLVVVPTHLHVTGIPDIAVSNDTLTYDSLFIGLTDTKTLTVSNPGTKTLNVSNIATTGDFTVDSTNLVIPPKGNEDINITFTPTTAGLRSGTLVFTSDDPDESPYTVYLFGTGVNPPVIGVNPASISDSLEVGDTSMHKLVISNTGQYNLIWQAAFIPDSADIHRVQPLLNNSSITDPEFLAKLEKDKNSNVSGQKVVILRSPNSSTYSNEDFEGGVPPTGWTVIDNAGNGVVWTTIIGSGESGNYCGTGEAATASSDAAGSVEFDTELRTPNMNLSAYNNIYFTYDVNYQNYANSDFLDLDVSTDNGSSWTNILSWNEDHGSMRSTPGEQVAILIDTCVSNLSNVMFRWHYYDPNTSDYDWYAQIDNVKIEGDITVVQIDPGNGITPPSGTDTMDVKFDARNVIGGKYFGHLGIQSNDPITPLVDVPLYINVTGIPDVALSTDSVQFGDRMVRGTYELTFDIQNTGTDWLDVTNIVSNNSVFTVDRTNFKVRTTQPETVTVYFEPTAVVDYTGTLTIFNNDSTVHVYLTGTGVPAPEISVTPDSLSETLNLGSTVTRNLRISNSGSVNLDFTLSIKNWSYGSPISLKKIITVPKFNGTLTPDINPPSTGLDMSNNTRTTILLTPNVTLDDNSIAYICASTYGDDEYATFDVTTPGTFNIIEPNPTWRAYGGDFADDGELYITDPNDNNLYHVDIVTGAKTLIGASIGFSDMGFDATSGTMYAINASTGNLYTVDITTGATIVIGNMGVTSMIAIAVDDDGNLWGYSISDDNFYSINKSTGAATLIGPLGYNTNYAQSMDYDPMSGNLYMAAYGGGLDGNLRIIDRTTGASTLVGSFNGGKEVMMMAFPSTTPWLSLDTTNGSVPPSGYVDIEVTFDANVNMGGDYFADIMISSNDPGHPEYKVPAHMHVIGVPNIVTSTDSLSFGDVYTGQTDTLFVAFMNDGTDVLEVTDITNSLGVFSTNLTSFSVEVGDTQFVEFYFTPTETGLRTDAFVVASNDTGNPSYYIYAQGNGIPGTGLEDELLGIPKEYSVDQNFPNPFNPSTTIRFGLPEVSSVSIIVYDVLGRKVTELFEGIKTAGFHRVVWNANVASGVYLFRIVAKSENSDKKFVDVRKMILLK